MGWLMPSLLGSRCLHKTSAGLFVETDRRFDIQLRLHAPNHWRLHLDEQGGLPLSFDVENQGLFDQTPVLALPKMDLKTSTSQMLPPKDFQFHLRGILKNNQATFVLKGRFFLKLCNDHSCRLVEYPLALRLDSPHKFAQETRAISVSFLWVMVCALLGGFLLNFMPCVLPVLGMKLSAFSRRIVSKAEIESYRLWNSVGGILFGFSLLAFMVIALKFIGVQAGWGFIFKPYFISAMLALILTLLMTHVSVPFQDKLFQYLGESVAERTL